LPHACELFNTVAGCQPRAASGREPRNDGVWPSCTGRTATRARRLARNVKIDKGYLIVRTISYRNHQT
jgi:hypothetical protein